MKKSLFVVCLAAAVMMLASCQNATKKAMRAAIQIQVEGIKSQMPIPVPTVQGMSLVDVMMKGDMVVYTVQLTDTTQMIQDPAVLNSDKNYARTLSNMDSTAVNQLVAAEVGLQYNYVTADGKAYSQLVIEPQKMKDIRDRMRSGELKPYSVLEMSQIEINQMQLPAQVSDILWLTDAVVKDNFIIYEFTFEAQIEKSDISDAEWDEIRMNTADGLRESPLIMNARQEIVDKDIHFSYVYKDVRDTILTIFDITSAELF